MAQEQIGGIRSLLEEFEDNQLEMTLQLEVCEGERKLLAGPQPSERVNLSDEDQQAKPRTSTQLQSAQQPELELQGEPQPEIQVELQPKSQT